MPTKPTTPEAMNEALAAELAAHDQARAVILAKQAALRDAATNARKLAEITHLRDLYNTVPDQARKARTAAAAELDAIAAEPEIDIPRLFDAFTKRQQADALCSTAAAFVFRLEAVDPLPNNLRTAQPEPRPPRAVSMYTGAKFTDYLDALAARKASQASSRRYAELTAALDAAMDSAEREAIVTSGGAPLNIDMPESAREQLQAVLDAITPDDVEAEAQRLGRVELRAARFNLERAARERFIAEERGEDSTTIQPYTPVTAADNPIVMGKNGRLFR